VSELIARPGRALRGRVRVPGDKSISHRALLLGALAQGDSRVEGFLASGDCQATLGCLRGLGVVIERYPPHALIVHGRGLHGLQPPLTELDCVRSGTTMRLLAGILAAQRFDSVLTGDAQLRRRPMRRVTEPLGRMGAQIQTADGHAPLHIHGRAQHGADHVLPVASAQVKSALLLAGLYADGTTRVHQPGPARDHTERMLAAMGAAIQVDGPMVAVSPAEALAPLALTVPGDISSAAFPLVAATLVTGSEVVVTGVGLNPTRTGLLDMLSDMGAHLSVWEGPAQGGEPQGDIEARAAPLAGAAVGGDAVVRMIDEFPVLAVAATQAEGVTEVRDAAELRVKETDRIATVVAELRALGGQIEPLDDGFIVEGPTPLRGGRVSSHGDHRLAMALAVAGLVAENEIVIEGAECIADSFPGFVELMQALGADLRWG
jgi:3-phosphoshikimate 1-carboxyvinyltransferase